MNNYIDENAEQILLGSILGDGCISIPRLGKNAFFREEHTTKQETYLIWKVNFIKGYFKINTRKFERHNQKFICITTNCSSLLTNLYNLFYKNKVKLVNRKILDKINELGLAVWYCDDGNYRLRFGSCLISTSCFTLKENEEIRKWLKDRWTLDCAIRVLKRNNNKYFYLEFDVENANKFLLIIRNYVLSMPSCVWYKLGHIHEDNLPIIEFHKKMDNERCKAYYHKNKHNKLISN